VVDGKTQIQPQACMCETVHGTGKVMKRTLTEDAARFWSTIFGGITAIGLVLGGLYSLVQFLDTKSAAQSNLSLQLANAKFEAEKPFFQRQLELCELATSDAAVLSTQEGRAKADVQKAFEDFQRLYWGPLGIVEDPNVEDIMVQTLSCLKGGCSTDGERQQHALRLAHACRDLVAKSWNIELSPLTSGKDVIAPQMSRRPAPPVQPPQ
jgi:hypothetical protein